MDPSYNDDALAMKGPLLNHGAARSEKMGFFLKYTSLRELLRRY